MQCSMKGTDYHVYFYFSFIKQLPEAEGELEIKSTGLLCTSGDSWTRKCREQSKVADRNDDSWYILWWKLKWLPSYTWSWIREAKICLSSCNPACESVITGISFPINMLRPPTSSLIWAIAVCLITIVVWPTWIIRRPYASGVHGSRWAMEITGWICMSVGKSNSYASWETWSLIGKGPASVGDDLDMRGRA